MNKKIIKCLKNSIAEKGNYCYSLPVETTKAVIKELNRLNNIINYIWQVFENGSFEDGCDCIKIYDYLKALKENNK